MGNYFLMSFRFNKQSCANFGLVSTENQDIYINSTDRSVWQSRQLYDYGWGKENGYFKIPMPDFNQLVEIVLFSNNEEDKYGAASVILDDFCDELLDKCIKILNDKKNIDQYVEFFRILQLKLPINRSPTKGKDHSCILADYEHWKIISEKVSALLDN